MKRRPPFGFFIFGGILHALPFLVLCGFGIYALFEEGQFLYWFIAAAVCWVLGWLLWQHAATPSVYNQRIPGESGDAAYGETAIGPEPFWSPLDLRIWEEVCVLASDVEQGKLLVEDGATLQVLVESLLDKVAPAYFPTSQYPRLEVTALDLLLISEQASKDIRTLLVEAVPLHHVLTLHDVIRAKRTLGFSTICYNVYRAIRAMANPLSALIGELKSAVSRPTVQNVSDQTTRWLIARLTEGAGKHLINLYGGNASAALLLKRELRTDSGTAIEEGGNETLKILFLGETGAGKSSLIQALFGELQTANTYQPETREILYYERDLPGIGRALLIDSPGFGGTERSKATEKLVRRELENADLVVLVSAATSAAREGDVRLLRLLQDLPRTHPTEHVPPLVVALTKIDLLRPVRRWNPPYDLGDPTAHSETEDRQKAAEIVTCVATVADELGLEAELVIPIAVRSAEDAYNLESVLAVMGGLLPQAQRKLLRRLLKQYKDEQYWDALYNSLKTSGRVVLRRGLETVLDKARRFSDTLEDKKKF